MISLKKAREVDIQYEIKESNFWTFDGERYQPVDDISELSDYQRRKQKTLQTIQNNGTPFLNNKRTFLPDMDATNSGNDIPLNIKQNMYGVSFQQNRTYASKVTFSVLLVNFRSLNKQLEELQVFCKHLSPYQLWFALLKLGYRRVLMKNTSFYQIIRKELLKTG